MCDDRSCAALNCYSHLVLIGPYCRLGLPLIKAKNEMKTYKLHVEWHVHHVRTGNL